MPKSNRGGFGGRRSGTVTVIEEPVRRSSIRTAKIVFYVLWPVVGLLSATVLASKWHPILALLAGIGIGLAVALIVSAVVLIWPVLRVLWWWAAEITLAFSLGIGWVDLADHTTLPYRIGAVVLAVGVPATIPPARRWIIAATWCLITRHRIRVCFSEFIITNRTGSLPLIFWAIPTPVGERIWIWLRPGLALADLQNRLDLIAVACWADTAIAESASASNSALVRLDIKRRNAFTAPASTPLLNLITPGTPPRDHGDLPVPTALDLPDVTTERGHAPGQASHAHPRGQETTRARPGPGHHRPRHRRLALASSPRGLPLTGPQPVAPHGAGWGSVPLPKEQPP